jgi:hypothetical protein
VTGIAAPPVNRVEWEGAVRIIRSIYPPIDLFEDVADPADWPLLISAEQKTNPRIMTSIGNIDLVPPERRIGGVGASYLMAAFTHVSLDRSSRFSDGSYGVLYVARSYETALFDGRMLPSWRGVRHFIHGSMSAVPRPRVGASM